VGRPVPPPDPCPEAGFGAVAEGMMRAYGGTAVADVLVLICAAGRGTRMRGGDKLLEPVAERPLLRLLAERAVAAGAPVCVTLPDPPGARGAAAGGIEGVEPVPLPGAAEEGMAASLRLGAERAASAGACGLMVLPGDMPEIEPADISAMISAFLSDPACILRAAASGRPGNPVILPADLFAEVAGLRGDTGARGILVARGDRVRLFDLPGDRALVDLDTPEAWAAWRAARG